MTRLNCCLLWFLPPGWGCKAFHLDYKQLDIRVGWKNAITCCRLCLKACFLQRKCWNIVLHWFQCTLVLLRCFLYFWYQYTVTISFGIPHFHWTTGNAHENMNCVMDYYKEKHTEYTCLFILWSYANLTLMMNVLRIPVELLFKLINCESSMHCGQAPLLIVPKWLIHITYNK